MIFDSHIHLPSEGWPGHTPWVTSVDKAVAYLKSSGTDAALFNLWQGVFADTEQDLDQANEAALAISRQYAGFLFPGACIHPAFPETSRRWLAKFREQGHLWVGELVHYRKPYRYTDEAFMRLAADCAAGGHALQLHAHEDVYELARQIPALQVVCSHINVPLCKRLAELPNTWLDISGGAGGLQIGAIESAREAMGLERLFYGTDFTGYEPRCFQTRLALAVPDEAEREQIYSRNLLRLLAKLGSRRPG